MRYLLLTAALAMNMQAMVAQSSYQVKNSITLRNEDCLPSSSCALASVEDAIENTIAKAATFFTNDFIT